MTVSVIKDVVRPLLPRYTVLTIPILGCLIIVIKLRLEDSTLKGVLDLFSMDVIINYVDELVLLASGKRSTITEHIVESVAIFTASEQQGKGHRGTASEDLLVQPLDGRVVISTLLVYYYDTETVTELYADTINDTISISTTELEDVMCLWTFTNLCLGTL